MNEVSGSGSELENRVVEVVEVRTDARKDFQGKRSRRMPAHKGLHPGGPHRETRDPGGEAAAQHRQGLVQRCNRPSARRLGGRTKRVVV